MSIRSIAFSIILCFSLHANAQKNLLEKLKSPVLFKGDDQTAFRDPAVLYHHDIFYLFFTYVKSEAGKVYSYTAMRTSRDLKNWSPITIITPKDQASDFSSPGNIIRFKNEWILCLQTYPRPNYRVEQMPRFGNGDARIFIMRSKDLEHWSAPELIKVKGPEVSFADMGRMIDPYLLEDKQEKGKFWCFYKQNGVSMSYSYDLKRWRFFGKTHSGENACVLYQDNQYIMFHSPKNGIAMKRSTNLKEWADWGSLITLGQQNWPWAKGRLSAGAVIDLKTVNKFGARYLMFYHGSGPLTEEEGDFDKNASIGIAWSNDLIKWHWPK